MPAGKFAVLFFAHVRLPLLLFWYAELDKEEQCHRVRKVVRPAEQMFCNLDGVARYLGISATTLRFMQIQRERTGPVS